MVGLLWGRVSRSILRSPSNLKIKKCGLGFGMSILDLNDRGFAAVTGAKRPKLFNFDQ